MPLVSVVMVAHQDTPFVRPAVTSIFNQTLQDFEFVFVNNGSGLTPGDFGAAGTDPRLRWLELGTNRGIVTGINAGIRAASGEYVAILDSDDIALPARLEKQVAMLQSDPTFGLVNCGVATIDPQGRVIGREFVLIDGPQQKVFAAYYSSTLPSAFTMRREVAAGFPQRLALAGSPDYDFFARVAEHWRLGGVPEILVHYRRHPLQYTITARAAQIFCECSVRLMSARRRTGLSEQLESIEQAFDNWRLVPTPPAEIYAGFARQCLHEGYATLAVYHARKLVSAARTPSALLRALELLTAALLCEPCSAVWLLRLFLTGPVRAHGLNPL